LPEILSNVFQNNSISHVTSYYGIQKILKLFQNYFGDIEHVGKYSRAATSLWNNFETILFHM